ncbi:MAG: aminopeptidase P family protein, partial [Rhodospirillales bacterium]|nr:aminopeptidase P family protein [Rhodospirillales bacterium]
MRSAPARGFQQSEFENRMEKVQQLMHEQSIDAVFLTQEPDVRYFTGFFTQFWESPTRPWFLILPAKGKPIAIIPEIGTAGMVATWVEDIRTWSSPRPEDEGISLVVEALKSVGLKNNRIGVSLGHESLLRMPAGDYEKLLNQLSDVEVVDTAMMLHQVRYVKSKAEIEKIRYVCELTSDAFEALPQSLRMGESERQNCQRFRIDLLERGADNSPYIVAGSGHGGYDSIIMGPTDRIIENGDVLIIDTGTVYDGYFCDFDRNFAFGKVDDDTRHAHEAVFNSTDAGFAAAIPGATTTDVWKAMWDVLEAGGALSNDVGRMGHGLGMQLTEWP